MEILHRTEVKLILSSEWGGTSRPRAPPLRLQLPSRRPVGQPHALPSGISKVRNNTTHTPVGSAYGVWVHVSRCLVWCTLSPTFTLR